MAKKTDRKWTTDHVLRDIVYALVLNDTVALDQFRTQIQEKKDEAEPVEASEAGIVVKKDK